MKDKSLILNSILTQGMLPLFYHESADVSAEALRALYTAGIRVVEYTNRGVHAATNFRRLKEVQRQEMKDLQLGIGTIKNQADAEVFVEAGADFLISPVVNAGVAAVAQKAGLLWIPGCMTPTEINNALELGVPLVKIFPANILGREFIKAVKELFPGLLFMPTGGVDQTRENITGWFDAGVCAVGMGSKLISKELLQTGNYGQLVDDTRAVLSLVAECNPRTASLEA